MPFPDQPDATPIPTPLKRWNWGAFFLNWLWAIGNNCWWPLLVVMAPFLIITILLVLAQVYYMIQYENVGSAWIPGIAAYILGCIAIMVVFGMKGSNWAWKYKLWRDERHFRTNQRKWAIAGFAFLGLWLVGMFINVAGLLTGF
ncbi:hypothetical protein AAFN47_08275 [Hoeflea sp. CAU 1731]